MHLFLRYHPSKPPSRRARAEPRTRRTVPSVATHAPSSASVAMGAKKKQTKQTRQVSRAPVVAADDAADDALLDAMIAANLQAAAAAEEELVMAGLDLIAPGQFAREAFPGLASSCAMCGQAAAALPCSHCKLRLYCGKECQQAAWRLCHKRTCGAKTPTPTPSKLARAGSEAVVDALQEFGGGC